jgi:signal transduction histidine kinase
MKERGSQTRRLLLMGFGGLLLLLAITGLNALSVLKRIQSENERIRADYVNRDRILEQLRSDIYLSGTYVRDFLLEPDPALADVHRTELESARARIQTNENAYRRMLREQEIVPFERFALGLRAYFDSLEPALQWNPGQRRALGYSFMKESLLPRRMEIVRLTDQISQVNQSQLEIGNREVSELFGNFRRSLIILSVATFVCGLLVAGGSMLRLLQLERLSSLRFAEVEQARSAQRELSARLLEIQESERKALSRELHDEVGQAVSSLLLGIGNVASSLSSDGKLEALRQLEELHRLAETTVAEVRDMALLLRPSMLDDLGLLPALQWQARETSRTTDVAVEIHAGPIAENLPEEHKTCIYRIVQEALHNVVRHAKAKRVWIYLGESEGNQLRLTIEDDGQGFSPENEKGLGLLGMKERVMHLHGSFHLESRPGRGTSIQVELPFSDAAAKVNA